MWKWSIFGFCQVSCRFQGFKGIKPKYLTTEEASGILKRYRLEKKAIASFDSHTFGTKQCNALLPSN
jgi:hypothetical protein